MEKRVETETAGSETSKELVLVHELFMDGSYP